MVFDIREGKESDVFRLPEVKRAVKENVLPNPLSCTYLYLQTYIFKHGKGWVCETNNKIVSFEVAICRMTIFGRFCIT